MSRGYAGGLAVWDTGLAGAADHREADRAQWQAARDRQTASLRFWRSHPAAYLGRFEALRHALRPEVCRNRRIPVVRRATGGGAWYLDERQLGWTLALPEAAGGADAAAWLAHLGKAAATALADLGLGATFAGFDAIEADGRKLGALGVRAGDGALLVQGTVLLEVDVATMLQVLRVPKEKLTPEGLAGARGRMATVAELAPDAADPELVAGLLQGRLAQALGASCWRPQDPLEATADPDPGPVLLPEPELTAFAKAEAGVVHAGLTATGDGERVAAAELSGPLQLAPADLPGRLADHLVGTAWAEVPATVRTFLAATAWQGIGVDAEDLAHAFALARDRRHQQADFGLAPDEANTLMLHDPEGSGSAAEVLARAEYVLVPYCAKPAWCKWRHRDGCPDCGMCEVGEVYRLARERGLPVTTVGNFEHLRETLGQMADDGVAAYVGMCCSNFFLKREYAFRDAGMPALLMDIAGANCYELGQEELAYRGEFTAEAELNGPVIRKVLPHLPPAPRPGDR